MARRDIVQEISARRERNPASNRIDAFGSRHNSIANAFEAHLKLADPHGRPIDEKLCRYFPIASVAAIEGYFSQCVADLVNAGGSFPDRAVKLKDMTLSVAATGAIQHQRITTKLKGLCHQSIGGCGSPFPSH